MHPVIVFDVGGTWFRSAILAEDDSLHMLQKKPAITYRSHPDVAVETLQQRLVSYLVEEVQSLSGCSLGASASQVGISLGAVVDANTGLVLDSGPLWGPRCNSAIDILGSLRQLNGSFGWTLVNDLTAGLTCHARRMERCSVSRLTLITVSSGIGARTYDMRQGRIPVGRSHGIQGEIGHIPVRCEVRGGGIELQCDCGGNNHLNAFSSGIGIERVVNAVARAYPDDYRRSQLSGAGDREPGRPTFEVFPNAARARDPLAIEILDAVTAPLAAVLIHMLTVDCEVETVLLTGGVVDAIGETYRESLLRHLERLGLYQVTNRKPHFWRDLITLAKPDDHSPLVGAGIVARSAGNGFRPQGVGRTWDIRETHPVSYAVVASDGVLSPGNPTLRSAGAKDTRGLVRRLVVIDRAVDEIYGAALRAHISQWAGDYRIVPVAACEAVKTTDTVLAVAASLDEFGISRRSEPIIVIGGGVLIDIVGLTASLFRRGVPYVRVPTTLLSLVDAAVGVKTGVNFAARKNRLGSYYPPVAAVLDRTFLRSLDDRQVRNGMAEIIKVALMMDERLFSLLEEYGDFLLKTRLQGVGPAQEVIHRAVSCMIEEIRPNLWEHRLERLVDFGHWFSPALEMASNQGDLLHGEAVAIDMSLSVILAARRGYLSSADRERFFGVIDRLQLPSFSTLCTTELILGALEEVVRHRDGLQRLPLPTGIGSARFVNDVDRSEVVASLDELLARGARHL